MQISRADALAKVVNFYNKNEVKLYHTIKGYNSSQHSCVVAFVLYRVWNAVKAIFGKSDWQKAVNFGIREIKAELIAPEIPQVTVEKKVLIEKRILNSSQVDKAIKSTIDKALKKMLSQLDYVNKLAEEINDYETVTKVVNNKDIDASEMENAMFAIFTDVLKMKKEDILLEIEKVRAARKALYKF